MPRSRGLPFLEERCVGSSVWNKLNLIETILPLVLGIAGGVALLAGILLARRPRADMDLGNTSPESAADAAPGGAAAPRRPGNRVARPPT